MKSTSAIPEMEWPEYASRPTPSGRPYHPKLGTTQERTKSKPAATPSAKLLKPLPRGVWAQANTIVGRVNPMNGIDRITVHHEGSSEVVFSDYASTANRLESIRQGHLNRMTAGDIGYHFIVDRAGRIWEGRPLKYQGAHVKQYNPHNIGVMVLGNFNLQSPTSPQLQTLSKAVKGLRRAFGVSLSSIHTHQELAPTACPGNSLQPRIEQMRRNGAFT